MDAEFWHQRWQEQRIGFHQSRVSPMLEAHWASAGVAAGGRVFVPLCGKSLDMPWLAALGHTILGVELSQLAVDAFFDALGLAPRVRESRYGRHHAAGPYELVVGDALLMDEAALADCSGVFDRAALVALPAPMRGRYLGELYARLPSRCRGLLVTLEYPRGERDGPPFAVAEAEVREALRQDWTVELLERRDILAEEPGFAAEGVSALATCALRVVRH